MAFFKTTRDQLKVNSLVSNLEFAKNRFSKPSLASQHIRWAVKAMEKIKRAKAEYVVSREGWLYIANICNELQLPFAMDGDNEASSICGEIWQWAMECEDRIGSGGLMTEFRKRYKTPTSGGSE